MHNAELTIHFGMPKCGSTALQLHFWKHRKWLQERNILYPELIDNETEPKQQFMVSQLLDNGINFDLFNSFEDNRSNILLSAEGLTNHLYDFPQKNLDNAHTYFSNRKTVGFVIYRPRESWIKSYYTQCILNPPSKVAQQFATALTLADFSLLPKVSALADYKQVSLDLKKYFGLSRLVEFELSANLLKEIESKLGIPHPIESTLTRSNTSPAAHIVEIIRQLNSFEDIISQRNVWMAAIQEWSGTQNAIMNLYRTNITSNAISRLDFRIFDRLSPNENSDFSLKKMRIEDLKTWAGNFIPTQRQEL